MFWLTVVFLGLTANSFTLGAEGEEKDTTKEKKVAKKVDPTGTLAFALEAQKSYWKFSGIITLVIVAIAVVGIGAAILIPQLAKV
jgi:hypothetical protein